MTIASEEILKKVRENIAVWEQMLQSRDTDELAALGNVSQALAELVGVKANYPHLASGVQPLFERLAEVLNS